VSGAIEGTGPRITRHPAPVYPGISDSVRVGAGDLLYVSGVVGLEDDGSVPPSFERAVELAYAGLRRALAAGGAAPEGIVRVGVYIAGLDHDRLIAWRAVRDRLMGGGDLPASTLLGVQSLVGGDAIAAV
jgi:2-iminobutanoate/2-iminopropanoate deaminase